MIELLQDLITHYYHLNKKEQLRSVNFVRYFKQDEEREKPTERLETTMANQTIPVQQ